MVVAVVVLALGLLALALLTGIGERRRGAGGAVVVVAGLFFPLAWLVWHLRDEQPYRRGAAPLH
ncbi:hypothetical protein [Nocardioides daeguensis]|uniref:Cardiolipin synthase N-terminal domain-containing protein n=1 Tax=Nocardioides daeguensis TaxID=908359 RepID=A0ABP6UST9_9ACTN|nr:hypothetical protein [Nocardioides daeguensis]MBV6725548.1 hypothetical protein [Nocardioides daeguensis]MCR1771408.1 hypothetical protein [Nocardioides daeguensis]